jgi:O-antigen ligase
MQEITLDRKIDSVATSENSHRFGFALLILYLFFEYGRPQGLIPALNYLRPGIVIIGLLGVYLLVTRNVKFETVQSKCLLGFLILSAIHVPIAVNNFWAFQGAKAFLIYLIVFLAISTYVNSLEKLSRFINLWIGINIVCGFVGLKHGGRVPFSGFMGDENDFALVMNMAIPFAYFMFLGTDSVKKKIYYLSACCIFISANVASLSRGGFIGLVPVMLYCWYKTPKKVLSTVVIAILVGVLYLTAPATYWDEVRSIKEENIEKGTGESRWYYWKLAWKMFLDNPVIGVGTGNVTWNIERYQPEEDLEYRRGLGGMAAHSLYFTLIPELGLVGILLFSAMLYYSYKDTRKIFKKEKELLLQREDARIKLKDDTLVTNQLKKLRFIRLGINGALLGYLISGAFLSVFYYPHFWFLMGVSISFKNITTKLINK